MVPVNEGFYIRDESDDNIEDDFCINREVPVVIHDFSDSETESDTPAPPTVPYTPPLYDQLHHAMMANLENLTYPAQPSQAGSSPDIDRPISPAIQPIELFAEQHPPSVPEQIRLAPESVNTSSKDLLEDDFEHEDTEIPKEPLLDHDITPEVSDLPLNQEAIPDQIQD